MAQNQGLPSLMPGQAPGPGQANPMPGMKPPMGGPSAGVVDLVGPLKNLPEQVLTMELLNPQSKLEKYAVLAALDQKNRERKTMQAVQNMQAMQQNAQMQGQGTVAQQVAQEAQAAEEPVMAALGGLMRSYAGGGGVVAFAGGDAVWRKRLLAAGVPESFIAELEARGAGAEQIESDAKSAGYMGAQTSSVAPQINIPSPEERKQEAERRTKNVFAGTKVENAEPISPEVPPVAEFPPVASAPAGIAALPSAPREKIPADVQAARDAEAAKIRAGELRSPDRAREKLAQIDKAIADAKASKQPGASDALGMLRRDRELTQSALTMLESGAPPRLQFFDPAIDREALEREKARVAAQRAGATVAPSGPNIFEGIEGLVPDGRPVRPKFFEPAIDPEALAQFKAAEQAQAASAPRRQDLGGGSADIASGFAGTMPPQPTSGVPALISDYMKTLKARGESVGRLTEAEKGLDELMRRRIEQEEKFGRETLADTRRAAEEALARSKEFSARDWFELAAAVGADPRRGREFGALGKGLAGVTGRKEQEIEAARKTLAAAGKDERALQLKTMEMNEALQKAQVERERGNVKRAEELEDKAMTLQLEVAKYEDKLKIDRRELDIKELQAGKMNDIEFYLKHGPDAYARYKTAGQKPVVPLTYENASEAADKFLGTLPGTTYVRDRQEEARKAGQPVPDAVQIRQELVQRFLRDAGAPAGGAPATLPPEAIKQLKPGVATKFENGQVWTIENGVPKQVK